ncbi:MAG: hypothetical protein DDT32_02136 [Syntrophomonadaceae bacterium]|nr:hypothetical protein [Bacillota bacterium]
MNNIREHKAAARASAIGALSGYKFMMFGYWAGIWVHLNQIDPEGRESNPFVSLVQEARRLKDQIN